MSKYHVYEKPHYFGPFKSGYAVQTQAEADDQASKGNSGQKLNPAAVVFADDSDAYRLCQRLNTGKN